MENYKELEKEVEEKKKKNFEYCCRIDELEYEVAMYKNERKEKLIKDFNEETKQFIEWLEEVQNNDCLYDSDICRYELSNYDTTLEKFFANFATKINSDQVKAYYEFDKYTK